MKDWRIQRPASIWIETTVEAETLEQALELADEDFSAGDYQEAQDSCEVSWSKYWAEDEDGEEYSGEELDTTNA
ncbi:hypothetical protein UFOVP419_27 [uncultured Caudovirales phage]|uniref:Uncharacterized protein n=1 Tax=uncultured Caudovirales phage TaxID=2100421 RepID=A0A6J5M837_9CAUD|nr:hypothetical protein UFOVP419_27 [uncultured Caudovirales phage]